MPDIARMEGPAQEGCYPPWVTDEEITRWQALHRFGFVTGTVEPGVVVIGGQQYHRCTYCGIWDSGSTMRMLAKNHVGVHCCEPCFKADPTQRG